MSKVEHCIAQVASLDLNNQDQDLTNKYAEISKMIKSANSPNRTISVIATGEFSLPPDKVRMTTVIKSSKELIEDAKQSVQRRFEYVFQTMKKNRVKESDIIVSKVFNRDGKLYEVVYEVSAVFDDFKMYENVQNLFVEKLDKTVTVLEPKFFLSHLRTENIKRQASIQAMKNAKHIGFDIARSVGLGLGKPLSIQEDACHVKEGIFPCSHLNSRKTLNELIDEKTVSVSASIKVTFELKHKPKT